MATPKISLALPAYNEQDNLAEVLRESIAELERQGRPFEILVIDNCSTDSTVAVARAVADDDERVRVISHDDNLMYSGSCETALRESRGDYIAIMDSDGQATAADLPKFLDKIDQGAGLVIGWRKPRHDPKSRLVISAVFNTLGKWRLRYPHHDLNCGFRVVSKQLSEHTNLRSGVNFSNPELYVRARLTDSIVDEVTIEHRPRAGGGSSHDFKKMWQLFVDVNRYFTSLRHELNTAGKL